MNGLLLNVICAFTIANANPNIEKAQQTLDALYQNYAATNTCLLRENYPFDQDNKATYLASEEQAKRRNEYSYLWPYSGTFSAVNALLESTGNKKYKKLLENNAHFADLFNAAVFQGEQVLKPEDLKEADTDVSSVLKFNGHAETVQKVWDVVKKTAYGVDFVLWGLENQERIHYAMPLRHMIGDCFSYLKEYHEIAAKNRQEKDFVSSDEFLSNFKKTDRLHPVISLCVYYGEEKWDGPGCLKDMLKIPEKLQSLVSDYSMKLLQVRTSKPMQFRNPDVNTVFEQVVLFTRRIMKI